MQTCKHSSDKLTKRTTWKLSGGINEAIRTFKSLRTKGKMVMDLLVAVEGHARTRNWLSGKRQTARLPSTWREFLIMPKTFID